MAPLQKRAWYGLALGVVWALSILAVFIIKGGVTAYTEDQSMRAIVAALLVGGAIGYLMIMRITRRKPDQVEVTIDERDRAIIGRALRIQLWAVIISFLVWAVALTETYWGEGQIPVIFPYLMLMSTLITNVLAQSVGILIGYWRIPSDAQCS